jgi:hypothetical protein
MLHAGVRKIKKGCHAEALEACALGILNYALALMQGVKAFAHHTSSASFDTLRAILCSELLFRQMQSLKILLHTTSLSAQRVATSRLLGLRRLCEDYTDFVCGIINQFGVITNKSV